MHFHSTRDHALAAPLSEAIARGLAPDGGLYMPAAWPHGVASQSLTTLAEVGAAIARPFAEGDPLSTHTTDIAREALDIPAPVSTVAERLSVLELFHGPTAAFKDFGARFLAACLTRIPHERTLDILVATSGDTGGAVAAAFHRRPGFRVTLLFPEGQVSPTQERQLTCWGDNVQSLAVRGTFDDCQRMVKEAFADPRLHERLALTSANSINIARLLPQAAYYAAAALACEREHGEPLSFLIPSGNVGNAVSAMIARKVGFPIDRIVLAHNANRTVPDYLESGEWKPRPSVPTLATAMDVGNPSNMERVRAMHPDLDALRFAISADSVNDDTIRARITADHRTYGRSWCPHTATAAEVYGRLPPAAREGRRWCIVATAHPAKFPETVEPLIGAAIEEPPALRTLRNRETSCEVIDASHRALAAALTR